MRTFKRFTSVLLAALLLLTALPVSALGAAKPAELLLATVSDIHYYPEKLAAYKGEAFYTYLRGSNCVYENLGGILDSAWDSLANEAKTKGLKYLVACGDLTTNGEYEGHVELAERFRKLEKEAGIKVFVINGNHDVNNPDAADFSYPDGVKHPAKRTSPKDFYDIYYEFGFDEAVSRFSAPDTGKAGALSYALSVDGYRLIMIDAGKYTADNTEKKQDLKETGGNITPEVLAWVKNQVNAAKKNGETPIAFTHWNASEMNYLHGEVLQGFVLDNAYMLQETFADLGIHYIFSGHQHVSDISVTYSDAGEPLYSVISPTLTQFPYAYRESRFVTAADGTVKADFSQIDCDSTKIVESSNGAFYLPPYRSAGFNLQFGNGKPEEYLLWLAKGLLSGYIARIQAAGSVVEFLKQEFGLDVEKKLDELMKGGFTPGGEELFTVKNVMSFIADLDSQIMNKYIKDPTRLWDALAKSLKSLMQVQVSEKPCSKFLPEYGFGSTTAPGTLGDLFFSVMAYMYYGNEDISGDAFMKDVLQKAGEPAFVDLILDSAEKYIVEDFVVNELLANLDVHINSAFPGQMGSVAGFLQFFYVLIGSAMHENIFKVNSIGDFVNKFFSTFALVTGKGASYKVLLETVLGTGYVKYGSNVKELATYFIDRYFDAANKEATAHQIQTVLAGCVTDDTKDWNVSYNYTGPVKVAPTAQDMQLPTDLTLRLEDGVLTLHWLTKYSVTGTNIEISEKGGAAVNKANIRTNTAKDTYSSSGFSFGSFGILPWTREINAHTVTVSGLTPGKTYVYRIGDAAKGFWGPQAQLTVPKADESEFTFLYLTDYAASTPARAAEFGRLLSAAAANEPKAAFALLGGASALNGKDDAQFSAVINAGANTLMRLPVYYVSGAADLADTPNIKKHYNVPAADNYNDDLLGSYYSFDRGAAHIAVLNTNELSAKGGLSASQLSWLEEDLAGTHQKWTILALSASALTGENRDEALAAQLLKLAETYSVDLILEGSSKAYYRTNMIEKGAFVPKNDTVVKRIGGTVYLSLVGDGAVALCPGTAGAFRLPAAADAARYAVAADQYSPYYTAVSVYADDLLVRTYSLDNSGAPVLQQTFAVTKSGKKIKLGDVDLNGKVSAADARLALRYAVKLETLTREQKLAADTDFSKSVNAADARNILRAAVRLQTLNPETLEYYQKDLDAVNF